MGKLVGEIMYGPYGSSHVGLLLLSMGQNLQHQNWVNDHPKLHDHPLRVGSVLLLGRVESSSVLHVYHTNTYFSEPAETETPLPEAIQLAAAGFC